MNQFLPNEISPFFRLADFQCAASLTNSPRFGLRKSLFFLCPAELHTNANISMRIFPISLSFLVSGILFF
jgi:hypothetical protein